MILKSPNFVTFPKKSISQIAGYQIWKKFEASDNFFSFKAQMLPVSYTHYRIFKSFNVFTINCWLRYVNCKYWYPMTSFIEHSREATLHMFKTLILLDYALGCSEYQKISKFWCPQAFLGQKICPEKKLENGFFPKIDVAIVGWRQSFKLDLAPAQ